MRTILPVLLLTTALLAGCASETETDGEVDPIQEQLAEMPQLHGWVFDPTIAPIAGVEIEANSGNVSLTATTDADGFYGFPELPLGKSVVLIARLTDYVPQSKQTSLPGDPLQKVQLNFTLQPEPVITPYHDTLGPFQGFIQCQYTVENSEQNTNNECGTGNSDNQWSIAVGPDFAGGVIEIEWTENTAASHNLRATVECATPGQCGDRIEPFVESLGPSRLRLEIGNAYANKFFSDGGIMMLTVTVDPNNDAAESSVGSAVAVSQEFEAIASMFYHAPPPQAFSYDQ